MGRVKLGILLVLVILASTFSCKKETPRKEETKLIEVSGDLTFGTVKVNETKTKAFSIKNTGSGDIQVSAVSCPDGFSVDWTGGVIRAGKSKQVDVRFSPAKEKLYSGDVIVKSDAKSSSVTIEVSGSGQVDKPVLNVSPTSLDFGDVIVDDSKTSVFIIKNTGNASLMTESMICSDSTFSLSFKKDGVAAGSTQQVMVKFSPKAAHSYSGKITIQTNGGDAVVAVSGNGKAKPKAVLSISPGSLDFGKVTVDDDNSKEFTIANKGNATLIINSIVSSSQVYTLKYDKSIPAGAAQKITVKFSPAAVQTYPGKITIKTNGGNADVVVSGEGKARPKAILSISPSSLNFGEVTVGDDNSKEFTIANKGNATLMINSIVSSSQVYTLKYDKSIPAGAAQKITVKFSPAAVQTYPGKITIKTNGGNADVVVSGEGKAKPKAVLSISPIALDFGEVTVGNKKTETITISNTGDATLLINSITSPNSVYKLSSNSKNIPAGNAQNLKVEFTPASQSSYKGSITITTNVGSKQISVSGKGIAGGKPKLEVEQGYASIDFGTTEIGYYSYKTFHFYNTGNAPLTISSIQISNGAFTTPKFTTPTVIAANSSELIEVRFTPTAVGHYNGTMKINSDGGNLSISMAGQAQVSKKAKPILLTEYSTLNFGTLDISSHSYKYITFRLFNTGDSPLTISSVQSNSSAFIIENLSTPVVVKPNGFALLEVRFIPQADGNYSGMLKIYSDGGNASIPMSGQAVGGLPKLDLSPASLNFGNVLIGTKEKKSFRITNTGTAPLNILFVNASYEIGTYFIPSMTYAPIPPGGYRDVTIEFSCYFAKTYQGYFTIVSNVGKDVYLPVSATGVTSICNPITTPKIGYYPGSCDYNNGAYGTVSQPQTGIIEAAIAKIDCVNHSITFQFKRCDGDGFHHEGTAYVVSSYGNAYSGSVSFSKGGAYQNITITDNKMIGTKTYYIQTWQDPVKYPEVKGGWAVSNKITVTY